MSIHYDIFPQFNLLVYVFEGDCTASQYFNLYHEIYRHDPRRKHGMKVMMHLLNGSLELEPSSLEEAKQLITKNYLEGHPRDRVAFLTKSSAMIKLRNAFEVIADELPIDLEVLHNFKDAITWLGLGEHEQEIFQLVKDMPHT